MTPELSIIVPVYNAGYTLRHCIDSILRQSYNDFELLLIDDGSKDDSGSICNEYAQKDMRIRVFHKDNGGVSSARNLGLNVAQGKWIIFVDADDRLFDNALDIDYATIKEDLIIFSYFNFDGEKITDSHPVTARSMTSIIEMKLFYESFLHVTILKVLWSKFFKREIISDLRFDTKIRVGEDYLFMLNYLQRIQSCRVDQTFFYVYTNHDIDFFSKYQQNIDSSVYTLSKLFSAYKLLKVKSTLFEVNLFYDYKRLCQGAINRQPDLWFQNEQVKHIYDEIKKSLGVIFRIKYYLLSSSVFSKVNVFFTEKKS